MRLSRTLLAATAAAAVLTAANPALGAAAVPAAGSATSSATLVRLVVAGHTIAVGSFVAEAQTISSAQPTIRFVPLDVDGTKTGEVVVDPSNSPKSVQSVTTSGVPAGVVSATSPSATLGAGTTETGPTAEVEADLGSASILGMPLTLDGSVQAGSSTTADEAYSGKALRIGGIELPSIADLLAALGIDLGALPTDTVYALLTDLPLTLSQTVADAAAAANTAIGEAETVYGAKQDAVATATQGVSDAQAAKDQAAADFAQALTDAGLSAEQWEALSEIEQADLLYAEVVAAEAKLAEETDDLSDAQAALTDAQQQLTAALAALQDAIGDLVTIVRTTLDSTPIAAIGGGEVATQAFVGEAKGAEVVGTMTGLSVMGQDVFSAVFGSPTLEVADLAGTAAESLNTALATATSSLSGVLSEVTGLVFPAPVVEVLSKSTGTGTDGDFGTASASVTALKLTLGSVTIPSDVALPGADDLPGVSPTTGGYATAPLSFEVGVMAEAARYRAAVVPDAPANPGAPGKPGEKPTEELPATGAPIGLGVLALLTTVGGVAIRRMRQSD